MNIVRMVPMLVAGAFGIAMAAPASAACFAAPYNTAPVTTFVDSIPASQNATLSVNSTLTSSRNASKLTFSPTGRLEYNLRGIRVIWTSNKENCIPSTYITYHARFQSDGNLVVYWAPQSNPLNQVPMWASNTSGHPNARLVITSQDDLAIYDGNTKLWGISR